MVTIWKRVVRYKRNFFPRISHEVTVAERRYPEHNYEPDLVIPRI